MCSTQRGGGDRDIAVYRTLLRDLVGAGTSDKHYSKVYVLDAPVEGVTGDHPERLAVFGAETRAALTDVFGGRPAVELIGEMQDGMTATREGPRKGGVIITLGPIDGTGDRVEVGNVVWCGNACAAGSTHIVQQDAGSWRVTGTTGDGWMS